MLPRHNAGNCCCMRFSSMCVCVSSIQDPVCSKRKAIENLLVNEKLKRKYRKCYLLLIDMLALFDENVDDACVILFHSHWTINVKQFCACSTSVRMYSESVSTRTVAKILVASVDVLLEASFLAVACTWRAPRKVAFEGRELPKHKTLFSFS